MAPLNTSLPSLSVTECVNAENSLSCARMPVTVTTSPGFRNSGGLRPALAAIEAGKDLAVASKEILVMAGEIVMREARENGVHVLPVDSEHNAIFQALHGHQRAALRRILLTASGGPFREWSREDMHHVSIGQALQHPKEPQRQHRFLRLLCQVPTVPMSVSTPLTGSMLYMEMSLESLFVT